MCAQAVNPWNVAMEGWMERLEKTPPSRLFHDAWLRLSDVSTADLELLPMHVGERHPWKMYGLRLSSFGRHMGHFSCAVRDGEAHEERNTIFSCPRFTEGTHPDLVLATLACLYRLAPPSSELEVVLEDKLNQVVSTLAVAGTYTDAGWGLNPKRTELISEEPRLWIFRFSKN